MTNPEPPKDEEIASFCRDPTNNVTKPADDANVLQMDNLKEPKKKKREDHRPSRLPNYPFN